MKSRDHYKVDYSLWFMPQCLTALNFTSEYEALTNVQRLRYNQLHALYLNEQTMFFERMLAPVLDSFLRSKDLPAGLRENVRGFARDERRHTAMFRRLNRSAGGSLYEHADFCFVRVPHLARNIMKSMAARPAVFPFVLWLMHLQEERALYFGQQFLKCAHPIEEHFLETQKAHIADEVRHVSCDKELLDWLWPRTNRAIRCINVRFLGWLMREFFGPPKRAQINLVQQLVSEFPALRPRFPALKLALLNLARDERFLHSMYSRENVPDAFARFDRTPELWSLARAMPGYQPRAPA